MESRWAPRCRHRDGWAPGPKSFEKMSGMKSIENESNSKFRFIQKNMFLCCSMLWHMYLLHLYGYGGFTSKRISTALGTGNAPRLDAFDQELFTDHGGLDHFRLLLPAFQTNGPEPNGPAKPWS